jgi:hypothetical protein
MALQRDFKEFIAGLTWPLRGRKITMQAEEKFREDLEALRRDVWQVDSERGRSDDRLRDEIAVLRNDMATLTGQLGDFRHMLERSLLASEKITRGNFSFLFDRMTKLQEATDALAKRVPEPAEEARLNSASPTDSNERK